MISAFSLPGFSEIATSPVTGGDNSDYDDLEANPEIDTELYEVLPADHSSCFAHTLQLVTKDGFKEAEQLNMTIKKVPKLVSHVHRSTVATDILEGERKLETSCATRWNSEVKMISLGQFCVCQKKNLTRLMVYLFSVHMIIISYKTCCKYWNPLKKLLPVVNGKIQSQLVL